MITDRSAILQLSSTNADGRCMQLWPEAVGDAEKIEKSKLLAGSQYKMVFWVKEYFQQTGRKCFYPVVEVSTTLITSTIVSLLMYMMNRSNLNRRTSPNIIIFPY